MDKLCMVCGQQGKRTASNRKGTGLTRGLCVTCYARHYNKGDLETVALPVVGRLPERAIGETWVGADGYVKEQTEQGAKPQHRLVMECVLGRALVKGETVHHMNGDRADNRPANLELWASPQPYGQRVDDLISYLVEHHADKLRAALA